MSESSTGTPLSRRTVIGLSVAGGAVALVIAVMAVLAAVLPYQPQWPGELSSVEYTLDSPVPDPTARAVVDSDPDRVADMAAVLREHGWEPGWRQPAPGKLCAPSERRATLYLTFSGRVGERLEVASTCDPDPLAEDVLDLLATWPEPRH